MAIKGKRKSKQRAVPRAPRRDPVPVPVPFVRRRWVQVVAAFLLGVVAMTLFVVVTNAVRDAGAESDAAAQASERQSGGHRVPSGGAVGVRTGRGRRTPASHRPCSSSWTLLSIGCRTGRRPPTPRPRSRPARRTRPRPPSHSPASTWSAPCATRGSSPCRWPRSPDRPLVSAEALDLYGKAARVAGAALDTEGAAAERLTKVAVELRDIGQVPARRVVERVPRRPARGRPARSPRHGRPRAGAAGRRRVGVVRPVAGSAPVVIVANPTAGRGKAGKLIGDADSILRDLRVEHEIEVTGSPAETERACRAAAERGAAIVAVIGGDGTVSCAANGLLGTEAALGVIPAGTGDDFAKAIGAGAFRPAVRLLANPRSRARGRGAGPGRNGGAMLREHRRCRVRLRGERDRQRDDDEARWHAHVRGGARQDPVPVRARPLRARPSTGSRSRSTPCSSSSGAASPSGAGCEVLPDASLVDGLMDVCIVEALSKAAFLRAFPRVFAGRHTSHPKVRMLTATSVSVEANREILVYADGERIGPLPARFEMMARALPVVVGPDARGVR